MTNHSGPILAQRDNLTVIDCKTCGYAHLTEFPSEAALSDYYKSDFWQHTKSGALADFERQAEWWKAIHGDWLSIAEQHCSGWTLLDVGAGYGMFMDTAKARGWFPVGVDPSQEASRHSARRFEYLWHCGSWETYDDNPTANMPELFDCISAHWLIEHLPDPIKFLQWVDEHLSPGGVLLAVIPQEWTEAQAAANEIVKNKSWHLDPTHLNYFSQTSFANLLGRAGFRIVDLMASFQMERYITEFGINYVDNPYLGALAHRAVEQIELVQTREQRIAEARARAKYGRGRDLIVVARKD